MSTDWKTAYRTAIRERDQTKLFPLCDRARHAMRVRMSELGTQPGDVCEREQLVNARHRLGIRESKHLMIAALSKEDRKSVRRRIHGTLDTLHSVRSICAIMGLGTRTWPSCSA